MHCADWILDSGNYLEQSMALDLLRKLQSNADRESNRHYQRENKNRNGLY